MKWIAIQPLTGGMYFGTENATGNSAECIISFKGLDQPVYNKQEELIDAKNEYNLLKYLDDHNRKPDYFLFENLQMFDSPELALTNSELVDTSDNAVEPNFNDIDLVVAVPICSGLSTATQASKEKRATINNNMVLITNYALGKIRPKVYIFENAPGLSTGAGESTRKLLEDVAERFGYNVAYYKTNTSLHHNCQHRCRTFVYFFRQDFEKEGVPQINWEDEHISVVDYLNNVPKDAEDHIYIPNNGMNDIIWDFVKHKFGNDWRTLCKGKDLFTPVLKQGLLDELDAYGKENASEYTYEKLHKFIEHVKDKVAQNKGFWLDCYKTLKGDETPAIMYKSIPNIIHPLEDRALTIRECLALMGMPNDFRMAGRPECYFKKIGQNVPVRTAEFIVSQAKSIIENWKNIPDMELYPNKTLFNNIKQKIEHF